MNGTLLGAFAWFFLPYRATYVTVVFKGGGQVTAEVTSYRYGKNMLDWEASERAGAASFHMIDCKEIVAVNGRRCWVWLGFTF